MSREQSRLMMYVASGLFSLVLIVLGWLVFSAGFMHGLCVWAAAIWYLVTVAGSPNIASCPDVQSVLGIGVINVVLSVIVLAMLLVASVSLGSVLVVALLALVFYFGASAEATR